MVELVYQYLYSLAVQIGFYCNVVSDFGPDGPAEAKVFSIFHLVTMMFNFQLVLTSNCGHELEKNKMASMAAILKS